ncbi:MAG: hypothetical protein JNL82_15435 [Myxococcales bacterium]|nr:hypothetical protein [Myxococcales bacterium]
MLSPRLPLIALLCATACASDPSDDSTETSTSGDASTADATSSGPPTPTGSDPGDTDSADSTGATGGTSADSGTTDADGAVGCDGVPLLAVPEDTSLPGPWPVGARAGVVDDLAFEVWYPAEPGSDAGASKLRYDIRAALPDSETAKIPDDANPWQDCECYRDLPVDAAHGPYPVILFVHGTAGFRSQSLEFVTHWASRGFVVVAADHPGLWLKDLLGSLCGVPAPAQDLGGDLATLLAAVRAPAGDLAFLADRVDGGRVAMSGHSAGGFAVESAGAEAQVVMPMAGAGVSPGAALRSVLVLGAQSDKVVNYSQQQDGYADSPAPKRLVGLADAGHLAFSSLCSLSNADGQDFLEIAAEYDICGANIAGALFDCSPDYLPDPEAWQIVNYVTSAALEETLHCSAAGDNFSGLADKFSGVGEFLAE